MNPTRRDALNLFKKYNETDSLYKHALSVEAVMRHFAHKYDEDEEKWGIIGLIHDLDYEKYPEEHCSKTKEIMESEGWPEDYIRAVLSHAYGICTDVEPIHIMEKVLYATDELTGLVTTAALVRPDKSIYSLTLKSVKKRWKDKRFAAKVDRNIIIDGAQRISIELDELIQDTIDGMKTIAKELNLEGNNL
ncbi:HDIG domain-containing metalloprotein [Carboxylicivirga caseinilyticus]|uniref:HDIG domain-containing metalloprotein n=1 Tax=Carboxylicivirga caseinilyticus TaxID=3417572 RepID=UPI003D3445FB|nr:HDIG domain-containing protein [Marinilabiliaceae bacterium A049]